jgi:23S rRNA pseudouridine1911/1915/1917 synthase
MIDRKRLGFAILLETEHEIVVVKPAGVATELTTDPRRTSLLSRVCDASTGEAAPRLPHRLDRIARGLVVVALTDEAIRFHNEEVRERRWEKIYIARVRPSVGVAVDELVGCHKIHLRRVGRRARVVRSGGRLAVLEILAVGPTPEGEEAADVLVRLETGRFHQIRATMAALGAPLIGDRLYGGPSHGKMYLEHAALRFRPFGVGRPVTVHWREDPDRGSIASPVAAALDTLLARWEEADGKERGDQGEG